MREREKERGGVFRLPVNMQRGMETVSQADGI